MQQQKGCGICDCRITGYYIAFCTWPGLARKLELGGEQVSGSPRTRCGAQAKNRYSQRERGEAARLRRSPVLKGRCATRALCRLALGAKTMLSGVVSWPSESRLVGVAGSLLGSSRNRYRSLCLGAALSRAGFSGSSTRPLVKAR